MNWNNVKITIFKELRGIVRDRKTIKKILLFPLLIPFIILLFGLLFDSMENSKYVVGINYELTSVEKEILSNLDNIELKEYESLDKLKEAYENDNISGYIVKENNSYKIYTDRSNTSGEIISSYASAYLEEYKKVLASEYLISEGIDPSNVYNNIEISVESLKSEEASSLFTILLSLPIAYVLMIVVLTCSTVAIDATSGEKERGTLETILTFPVTSMELVTGKYLATAILGLVVGIISYMLTVPSIYVGRLIFKAFEDINITIDYKMMILALLVIVVSTFLSAGLCIALSGKSKTYKEAQSSMQLMSFLPMIPYFVQVMEVDNTILNLIPIANTGLALNDITMNNFNLDSFIVILVSSIIYIVLILIYISKQYNREEVLFG